MLSNTLTLDEEDAVQAELRELQAEAVRFIFVSCSRYVLKRIRRGRRNLHETFIYPRHQQRSQKPQSRRHPSRKVCALRLSDGLILKLCPGAQPKPERERTRVALEA